MTAVEITPEGSHAISASADRTLKIWNLQTGQEEDTLTGHVGWVNAVAMIVAHVQEQPVPPSRRTELSIPDSLERVILSCLEKDPGSRPQSAWELDALLGDCGVGEDWDSGLAQEWWQLHEPDIELGSLDELDGEEPQQLLTVA